MEIPSNRLVCLYGGKMIPYEGWNRESQYVYQIPVAGGQFLFLDGSASVSFAPKVNHSCDPNCEFEMFFVDGVLIPGVVSKRVIGAREFLSMDYGTNFDFIKLCLCGTEKCRHREEFLKFIKHNPLPYTSFIF